jgi:hypothetical protein
MNKTSMVDWISNCLLLTIKVKLQFGGRYRGKDKERNNTYDIYEPIE